MKKSAIMSLRPFSVKFLKSYIFWRISAKSKSVLKYCKKAQIGTKSYIFFYFFR
jgi:hypothetical protein